MEIIARTWQLRVIADGDTKAAQKEMRALQKATKQFGRNMSSMGRALTMGITAPVIAMTAVGISELNEMQKATAQTNAVLKSTGGVAGVTSKQVAKLSTSLSKLSGIDDQLIQGGQNILLTFTKISSKGGVFDRATKAALDLSVAFGKDMNASAILVGKALQDPIKGLSALGRVGVQFTAGQKKVIERLVETGKTAQAQKVILRALETQVGGSAAAYGTTAAGAVGRLKEQFSGIAAEMVTNMLPAFTSLGSTLQRAMDWFSSLDAGTKRMVGTALLLGAALGPVLMIAGSLVTTLAALWPVILVVTAPMLALGAATVALGAAVAMVVLQEQRKQNEFKRSAQAALEQVQAMRSLKQIQDDVAGSRLGTREAALGVERAERSYADAIKQSGRKSLEAREAAAQLARARLNHRDAVKREAETVKAATAESRLAIATVYKAQTAIRDEMVVRAALVSAVERQEKAKGYAQERAAELEVSRLRAHLGKLERAHKTNQQVIETAIRNGVVTRKELIDREGQHLAPVAANAGRQAGTAMGNAFTTSFGNAIRNVGSAVDNLANRVRQAAQANAETAAGVAAGRSGVGGKAVAQAKSSKALAQARLQAEIDASAERSHAQAVRQYNAAVAAEKKARGTKGWAAAKQNLRDAASNLVQKEQARDQARADRLQAEKDRDEAAKELADLEAKDTTEKAASDSERAAQDARDAENFRRRALGQMSVEEEIELAAANEIRAQHGLPPVTSMSDIGAVPKPGGSTSTSTSTGGGSSMAAGDYGNGFNGLMPSSASASAAVTDAAMRALGGITINGASDPEAVARRVAFILGGSRLRMGGAV